MENKPKTLEETKKLFENLKTDRKSVLFSAEKINKGLFKKLKKSEYVKDKLFLKLINLIENGIDLINKTKNDKISITFDYVEKREIDRSTLYSFDGSFQLIHANFTNLEFLGKSATIPRYALLIVDLCSSEVYVYPMRSRKQILQLLKIFYEEKNNKRKIKNMRLQVNYEFQQVKIKDLNDKFNVTMFTTSITGSKAFAAKQKIRKPISRIAKIKAISDKNKAKIPPTTIIKQYAQNMKGVKSKKYGLSPNDIEKKAFKTLFIIERIKRSKKISDRLGRYGQKKMQVKEKKVA